MADTAAEHIAQSLIRDIFSGRYHTGDALPSERDLAKHFDAYRGSVREAMMMLKSTGLVEVNPKGKIRIRPFWKEGGLEVLTLIFNPEIFRLLPMDFFVDVLRFRRIIWALAAESAANVCTKDDLDNLKKQSDTLIPNTTKPEEYLNNDLAFFDFLSEKASSPVVTWAHNSLKRVYESLMPLLPKFLDLASFVDFHRKLVHLLEMKDSSGARDLVLKTLEVADRGMEEIVRRQKLSPEVNQSDSE